MHGPVIGAAALLLLAACGGAARNGGGDGGGDSAARARTAAAADTSACAAADSAAPAREAAIAIDATVRAREVQVHEAPRTHARVSGSDTLSSSCTLRTNLPRPVRPGTYRDVEVRWRLRAGVDSAGAAAPDSSAPRSGPPNP